MHIGREQYSYSEESKALALKLHREILPKLIEEFGQTNDREMLEFTGYRLEEERTIRVLGCNISEEEFKANPKEAVTKSLMYSAGAQYWYTYEKEW